MNPKVSIIIPTFNRSHTIRDCLNSVLAQTFQGFEVIIVDDFSDDWEKTKEIVQTYDNRFKFLRLIKNSGISKARNEGFKYSSGQYLTFLDSDDLFMPKKLETQIKILDENTDAGMVYSDAYRMVNGKIDTKPDRYNRKVSSLPEYVIKDFIEESFIATMTVTVRRSIFEKVGMFDVDMELNEDDDLWLRIMIKYKVAFCEYSSGIRRIHNSVGVQNGNISRNRHKMIKYQFLTFLKNIKIYKDELSPYLDAINERTNKIFISYIFPSNFRFRFPQIEVLKIFYELKSNIKLLKSVD